METKLNHWIDRIKHQKLWNLVLFVSVCFAAFILPVFPVHLHRLVFRVIYSLMYISAIMSLNQRTGLMLTLFFTTLFLEWISIPFNIDWLNTLARLTNVIFFIIIVFRIIWQIAAAKYVDRDVIIGSFIGYLLLGIIFSAVISTIIHYDPEAFNQGEMQPPGRDISFDTSLPMYFSFVTMGTLGYGDVLPLKPYTRALATFITVTGQFYIAIIVALIVGKFSTRQK